MQRISIVNSSLNQKWSRLLSLELILVGIAVIGMTYFAHALRLDAAPDWGPTRVIAFLLGAGLCAVGGLLSLPMVRVRIGLEKLESGARYIQRAALWCGLALLLVELVMRVYGYTPVLWKVQTNWFGSVQAAGTSSLLGDEGFALTHYLELGEVVTPYNTGDNIIVLGDSRTEARQVADNDKYSSVAEELLHQRGVTVNVRNFGRSALAISDYVTHIPKYRELYQPRLFVVQLSEADLGESFSTARANYFVVQADQTLLLKNKTDVSGPLNVSKTRTLNFYPIMLNYAVERVNLLFPEEEEGNGNTTERSDAIKRQEIEAILQAADGTPVIFVLFPTVPSIFDDNVVLSKESFTRFVYLVRSTPGAVAVIDTLPRFQQSVKEGHLPVGFFNSAQPDRGHLNQYGNRIVGELLADAIEEALK